MVFGIAVLLAVFMVYPTLRSFLGQQAELNQTRRALAQAQADRDALQNDLDRWNDPAYVASQARTRLSFVVPGERAFRVVDVESVEVPAPDPADPTGTLTRDPGSAWYADIWQSVVIAGETAP